jgi:hypothetical protein
MNVPYPYPYPSYYSRPPVPQKGAGTFSKLIGIIVILVALVAIGAFIAGAIYYHNKKQESKFQPIQGGKKCDNGKLDVPTSSPDTGVGCSTLQDYNIYPHATIKTPATPKQAFAATTNYNSSGMTGYYCMQKCTEHAGCVAANCVSSGNPNDMSNCSCTGYSDVPSALAADTSDDCSKSNKCSTVYIQSKQLSS